MSDKGKKTIIAMALFSMVLCSVLLVGAENLRESDALNLCNVTDCLILLTELATESSEDCVQAKADHVEMLRKYVKHMDSRRKPLTFVLKDDIAEKLKVVIKELEKDEDEDEDEADQQKEACSKIERASKTITKFLSKCELFVDNPVVASEHEVVSEEMQATIRELLNEAHKKTQAYLNDLSMVNSEVAYRANRKTIVYLYLIRSECFRLDIGAWKEFTDFFGDINRTIYWNRVLERSTNEYERSCLKRCSANELRHLRVLHAIMDNDMREAHFWLQLAIKEAFPDMKFSTEK